MAHDSRYSNWTYDDFVDEALRLTERNAGPELKKLLLELIEQCQTHLNLQASIQLYNQICDHLTQR